MLDNMLTGENLSVLLDLGKILALAIVAYMLLRLLAVPAIAAVAKRTRTNWDETFVERGTFNRLAALIPGVLVHVLAAAWLPEDSSFWLVVRLTAQLWIMFFGLLVVYAILDSLSDIYNGMPFAKHMPIRSFVQVIKLTVFLLSLIVALAAILGESPTIMITGLGTMTAVLMLVFKDPILGFVAGITLSANRMLAVGDWMEMPKYNADGDVIDVTLTTVKVRNWDQTITTIPTYALISDSFKNWRGMQEAGGRRICRSVFIDMHSIRFLSQEDTARLCRAQLLSPYIREKLAEIEQYNHQQGIDPDSPISARRLTNVGTFRAYLDAYIKSHPGIHQNMISMIRQLQPTEKGLPIQVYAFTKDTAWVAHEGVQADIFDHILAVVEEFGLRVHQFPSGTDVRLLAESKVG